MIARALLAVLVLPGVFAGALPWLIASWDPWRREGFDAAALILGTGIGIVILCVRDFLVVGGGTLAPWDPPRHLVVAGLYRHVRNPMYVGVLTILAGTALLSGSPMVAVYAAGVAIVFHVRAAFNEEPLLAARFGEAWTRYAQAVPRWIPRAKPWKDEP